MRYDVMLRYESEVPNKYVKLYVPDNVTIKEIYEKLEETENIYNAYVEDDLDCDITKEDIKIMENVFIDDKKIVILNFLLEKYGWKYRYSYEICDLEYILD